MMNLEFSCEIQFTIASGDRMWNVNAENSKLDFSRELCIYSDNPDKLFSNDKQMLSIGKWNEHRQCIWYVYSSSLTFISPMTGHNREVTFSKPNTKDGVVAMKPVFFFLNIILLTLSVYGDILLVYG